MNNIKDQLYNIIDLYNNINSNNIEIKQLNQIEIY